MTERIKKDFIAKWLYRISRKAGSGKIGCFLTNYILSVAGRLTLMV